MKTKNDNFIQKIFYNLLLYNIENSFSGIQREPIYINYKKEILNCSKCKNSIKKVNTYSNIYSEIFIILEPFEFDEKYHFECEKLFQKMLNAINLNKSKVYITNLIKCKSSLLKIENMLNNCKNFLFKELEIVKPKIVLSFGKFAYKCFFNIEKDINEIRNQVHNFNNIPIIFTYHPVSLILEEKLKKLAWQDLKFFIKYLNKIK